MGNERYTTKKCRRESAGRAPKGDTHVFIAVARADRGAVCGARNYQSTYGGRR